MQYPCPTCGRPLVDIDQWRMGCPQCRVTFSKPGTANPAWATSLPADFLHTLGYLAIAANFLSAAVAVGLYNSQFKPKPTAVGGNYEAQLGGDAAPFLEFLVVAFVVAIFTFAVYPKMISGAWNMKYQRNWASSRLACKLAMLPFSPLVLLTLPIGIWGLRTLDRPGVREQFHS
jgi:hypothetical protein